MKYSLLKRISAFVLAFALVMTTAFNAVGTTQANAAAAKCSKLAVSAKKATVTVGSSKTITVTQTLTKKAKAKFTVSQKGTGKVTVKKTFATAKKAKGKLKITGSKAGTVTLTVKTKTKKTAKAKAKAVKKTITVTVKAKATTEAATTTAASADATTQATTELPALTSIEVAAGTKTLDIGGKTVVSAKSTTPGIEIASVTYSSDNSAAKVDANTGVVEGVSYGTAIITATALDANGNKATASVAIEVKALDVTVELVSSADGAVTLAPTETKKFGVKVTPATWTMEYTSSNEQVATVSADGTITAVAAGTAVISATAQGTAKRAICNVTVVASSYGIAWATPNHANSVKVAFTTPIAKADQDKLTIDLTYGGTKQDVTKKWAEDGSYVELVKASNYTSGTNYSVAISGTSVSIDKNAASKTFEIKDPYEDKIIIASGQAFPKADRIKVLYKVVDQYGDDFKTATPDKITWYLSSDNNRLSLGTKSLVAGNNTYGVAVIDLNAAFENVNEQQDYKFTVSVRGTLTAKSSVSSYEDVTIRPVQLTEVTLKTLNPNASGEGQSVYQNNSEIQNIPFTVNVKDENGQEWDPDVYRSLKAGAAGTSDAHFNNYYANNLDVRLSDLSATMAGADVKPEFVNKAFTGRFIISVPAGAYGSFSICLAANAKVNPQVTKVEVLKASSAAKVIFTNDVVSGKLGESVSIPVSFQDQYEKAIDTKSVAKWTDFTVSSDDLDSASIKALGTQITHAKGSDKFNVDLSGLKFKTGVTSGKFTITCGSDHAKEFKKDSLVTSRIVELTLGRTTTGLIAKSNNLVKKGDGYELNIIGGQREEVTLNVVDQYGDANDADACVAKVTGTVDTVDTVSNATKDAAIGTLDGGSVNLSNPVSTWKADKGSFEVIGAAVTKTESETLSVQLYASDGTTTIGKPITIKVNVSVKPSGFTIVPSPTKVTAGTPINITINAVNSIGETVTTYAGKHEIKISGSNGDVKTFAGKDAVVFENGTVTVPMPTEYAGKDIVYSTSISTADAPNKYVNYSSSTKVEIEAVDAKTATLEDDTVNSYLILTLYDATGKNPVKNPEKILNFTNVKVIDDITKQDVTENYLFVDSAKTVQTEYIKVGDDVYQGIATSNDLVSGVTLTATLDDYKIDVKFVGGNNNDDCVAGQKLKAAAIANAKTIEAASMTGARGSAIADWSAAKTSQITTLGVTLGNGDFDSSSIITVTSDQAGHTSYTATVDADGELTFVNSTDTPAAGEKLTVSGVKTALGNTIPNFTVTITAVS